LEGSFTSIKDKVNLEYIYEYRSRLTSHFCGIELFLKFTF